VRFPIGSRLTVNSTVLIWYKRLEVGTFRFPARVGDAQSINVTRAGLSMILEGMDLEKLPKRKRFSQKTS
jgi:hypothetical protein